MTRDYTDQEVLCK